MLQKSSLRILSSLSGKVLVVLLVTVLAGVTGGGLHADTVYLKNGKKLIGKITGQNRAEIRIRIAGKTRRISKKTIRRITYGNTAAEIAAAKKAAAEKKRRAAARKALAEKKRREAAARKAAAEKKRREAARKAADEKKRIAAEKKRKAEEARRAAAKKKEDEEKKKAELARKQAAEEKRIADEARLAKEKKDDSERKVAKGEVTGGRALLQSAFLPGRGLRTADSPLFGWGYTALFGGAFVSAVGARSQVVHAKDKNSRTAENIFILTFTSTGLTDFQRASGAYAGNRISSNNYKSELERYNSTLAFLGGLYLFQLGHSFYAGATHEKDYLSRPDFNGYAWRSLLLPGWGHMYRGRTFPGVTYLGLTTASWLNMISKRRTAAEARRTYEREIRNDLSLALSSGTYDTTTRLLVGAQFNEQTGQRYDTSLNAYQNSLNLVGAVYGLQLINVLDEAIAREHERPENNLSTGGFAFRSLLVPGWGHFALGRPVTGGLYTSLWAGSLGYYFKKTKEAKTARTEYNNTLGWVTGGVFLAGSTLSSAERLGAAYVLQQRANSNYQRAVNVASDMRLGVAAVYLIQAIHIVHRAMKGPSSGGDDPAFGDKSASLDFMPVPDIDERGRAHGVGLMVNYRLRF